MGQGVELALDGVDIQLEPVRHAQLVDRCEVIAEGVLGNEQPCRWPSCSERQLAAKAPTKMRIPLALCIFPCISLIILPQAALLALLKITPMLAGQ